MLEFWGEKTHYFSHILHCCSGSSLSVTLCLVPHLYEASPSEKWNVLLWLLSWISVLCWPNVTLLT